MKETLEKIARYYNGDLETWCREQAIRFGPPFRENLRPWIQEHCRLVIEEKWTDAGWVRIFSLKVDGVRVAMRCHKPPTFYSSER